MNWDSVIQYAWQIAAVGVLVFLNGFFVAAEFALVKVRDTQLAPLAKQGIRRARVAKLILKRLDSFLSAAQLGITLASLGLGWIGEPVFSHLLEPVMNWIGIESETARTTIAVVVGMSAITFLHITAGEQAPKWLAIQKPLPTVMWVAYPMLWFHHLSYPFVVALNWSAQAMLRQVGIEPAGEGEGQHSEEELRLLLISSHGRSSATDLGRSIVVNALDLRRRIARDVMRPRQEIVGLDTEAAITDCLELAEKTRYSRFPLCEGGDLDRTLGVVHFKDLFAMRLKASRAADLAPVARKLIYIPETARLETLLRLFLERKLHFAIVVDEYGGTVGMVTLENILEELVGPIQDEFDQEKPLLVKTGETTWDLDGMLPLHELAELTGVPLQEEGLTTTSGWVSRRQGGYPKVGDVLVLGEYQLRVEAMDGLRVSNLKLTRRESGGDTTMFMRR